MILTKVHLVEIIIVGQEVTVTQITLEEEPITLVVKDLDQLHLIINMESIFGFVSDVKYFILYTLVHPR